MRRTGARQELVQFYRTLSARLAHHFNSHGYLPDDLRPAPATKDSGQTALKAQHATSSALAVVLAESALPVRPAVNAACEILGIDPLYVANEGRFVAFVPAADADRALQRLARHQVSSGATRIGVVSESPAGLVTLQTAIGTTRMVDLLHAIAEASDAPERERLISSVAVR
jgi:hypothetical protein